MGQINYMTQGARELLMERLVLHKIVFFTLHSSRPMNPRYRRDDEHLLVRGFCGRTEEPVLQDIVKQLYDSQNVDISFKDTRDAVLEYVAG